MIRNLLSDRFKLEFRWSKREMAMYDLVVAKGGPKLKEWVDKPADDAKDDPAGGGGGGGAQADADGYQTFRRIVANAWRSMRRGRLVIGRLKNR